jgi:hypothetical protein
VRVDLRRQALVQLGRSWSPDLEVVIDAASSCLRGDACVDRLSLARDTLVIDASWREATEAEEAITCLISHPGIVDWQITARHRTHRNLTGTVLLGYQRPVHGFLRARVAAVAPSGAPVALLERFDRILPCGPTDEAFASAMRAAIVDSHVDARLSEVLKRRQKQWVDDPRARQWEHLRELRIEGTLSDARQLLARMEGMPGLPVASSLQAESSGSELVIRLGVMSRTACP